MLGIAGSVANALHRKTPCSTHPDRILDHLPNVMDLIDHVARIAAAKDIVPDLDAALCAFATHLAFTRDLIVSMTGAAAAHSADREIIADSLRRLASLCFVVRNLVGRIVDRMGTAHAANQDRAIDRMLQLVSAGGSPCLDSSGNLCIHGWAERRVGGRSQTGVNVLVDINGRRCPARIVDASRTGLGLSHITDTQINDDIMIQCPDGSTMRGIVVWARDGSAGVQLHQHMDEHTFQTLRSSVR
jgi:hypothetical protein